MFLKATKIHGPYGSLAGAVVRNYADCVIGAFDGILVDRDMKVRKLIVTRGESVNGRPDSVSIDFECVRIDEMGGLRVDVAVASQNFTGATLTSPAPLHPAALLDQ
jgi:hypothetical protein